MDSDKKLTISTVVSYSYPYIGSGIGNVAEKQAQLFAGEGHQVFLLSSNFPQSPSSFERHGVNVVKFPALFFLEKLHVPVPLTVLSLASYRSIAKSDIVHIHDGMYLSSFWAALAAKMLRKKLVVTVHINHIHYENPMVNLLERIAELVIAKPVFMMADKIVLINKNLEVELKDYKTKMVVISNGVDDSLFFPVTQQQRLSLRKKYDLDLKKKLVLFVGRLVPKKGFKLVMDANSNEYEILFVGTGEVTESMRQTSGLRFLGPKSQEELAEFYQLSDVLVLPSHGEGYPLSIKEALASGLPVITTFEHSSLTNLIGKLVYLVDQSVPQIKTAIHKVLKNESSQKFDVERKRYLEKFSWNNNFSELNKVYQSLYK